jgi:hypothetical protein
MKTALLAAAITIGSFSPALADAFDDNFDAPAPTIRHRVWIMRCNPDEGAPYFVGWDAGDRTIQIKTPHGRVHLPRSREPNIADHLPRCCLEARPSSLADRHVCRRRVLAGVDRSE